MIETNNVWASYLKEYSKPKDTKSFKTNNEHTTPEEFVYRLLHEANDVCDNTNSSFNTKMAFPPFYNEELFRKGQQFFLKHLFSLSIQMVFALTTIYYTPIIKIEYGGKNNFNQREIYVRLLKSLFGVEEWMKEDFNKTSKLTVWESVKCTRAKHSRLSRISNRRISYPILQKDMSITVFIFIGYVLTRPNMIGDYNVKDEELESFVHMWRVLGHFMGIDDKYNLCRKTMEETRAIMNVLIESVFIPCVNNPSKEFEIFLKAGNSLKTFNPLLSSNAFERYNRMLLFNTNNVDYEHSKALSFSDKIRVEIFKFLFWITKFDIARVAVNKIYIFNVWLVKLFSLKKRC